MTDQPTLDELTPADTLAAYWAKHDPDGKRRVRLSTRPEMRAEPATNCRGGRTSSEAEAERLSSSAS